MGLTHSSLISIMSIPDCASSIPAMADQLRRSRSAGCSGWWRPWVFPSTPRDCPASRSGAALLHLNPPGLSAISPSFNLAGFGIIDCRRSRSEEPDEHRHPRCSTSSICCSTKRITTNSSCFSADADFTPSLRKLRRWDRHCHRPCDQFPSAAYRASADLLIDQDLFVRDRPGFRKRNPARQANASGPHQPATADIVRATHASSFSAS